MNPLRVAALGPTSYRDGLALQERLVAARAEGRTGDWLLFPEHPPVLTVGRHPSAGNLRVDPATLSRLGIEVFEVARGGDITWHGPGQLVGYAIVGLEERGRDLHRYLRGIETALIRTLARFGIAGGTVPGKTGVWVGEGEAAEKIASIGIAVRRWVGYHGFALNVEPELGYFDLIHPCGLQGVRMTSVAGRLGPHAPAMAEVRAAAAAEMAAEWGLEEPVLATRAEAWEAAGLTNRVPDVVPVHPTSLPPERSPSFAAEAAARGTEGPS